MHSTLTTEALVLKKNGEPLRFETLIVPSLGPNQVLVELYATGICHTDLTCTSKHIPFPTPSVLGHEGAGIVAEVGSNVASKFAPGDNVILSFNYCGSCAPCESGHPAYCQSFRTVNAPSPTYTSVEKDLENGTSQVVLGHFFGQSSFARHAVVEANCVVKLPTLSIAEFALFAPLGCGVQTGAGCVLNTLKIRRGASFAIFGAGAVGLSAMLAAKNAGADPIIAIDLMDSRLQLAKDLGATHILKGGSPSLVDDIKRITSATLGVEYAVDATGVVSVIENMVSALGTGGKAAGVGITPPGAKISLEPGSMMMLGTSFISCTEGDCVPHEFIPFLISEFRAGSFPLDKLITKYPKERFQDAIRDMTSGKIIKPILIWRS